jgi:Holliday junction DNA helicase RuvA
MYDFLTGKVADKSPTRVVLDVNGIGYRLEIPVSTYERVQEAGARPVRLLTHLHVREDDLRLYGFATEGERRLFEHLLTIKGIGPVIALNILSGSGVHDVVRAIKDGDTRFLTRLRGVGKKTAERVVLELRDKAADLLPASAAAPAAQASPGEDAVRALVSLGYSPAVARKAVDEAAPICAASANGGGVRVESLVKEALRHTG